MIEKKAILIVSFGTSYKETERKCIAPIEDTTQKIFKDYEVRRAFTSKMIIRKLAREGKIIPTPEEAVKQIVDDGFTHLIVQPLHFMKGHEYHNKIVEPLLPYRDNFGGFAIGEPLLSGENDFDQVTGVIKRLSESVKGEKIVFMGHGTDHPSDSVYSTLQKRIDEAKINAKIATVEGSISLNEILPELLNEKPELVHLFPLMLVAGDHANNDMAGNDDSWKTALGSNGINAIPHLQGMGELMKIRQIFIKHIRACKKELFPEKYRKMREAGKAQKSKVPREEIPWFPTINSDLCYGCGLCFIFCHRSVFLYDESRKSVTVNLPCNCVVNCSHCTTLCSAGAISFPEKIIYRVV